MLISHDVNNETLLAVTCYHNGKALQADIAKAERRERAAEIDALSEETRQPLLHTRTWVRQGQKEMYSLLVKSMLTAHSETCNITLHNSVKLVCWKSGEYDYKV